MNIIITQKLPLYIKQKITIFKENLKTIYIHFGLWFVFYVTDYVFIVSIRGTNQNFLVYISNAVILTLYFYSIVYFLISQNPKNNIFRTTLTVSILLLLAVLFKNVYDLNIIKNPVAIKTFEEGPFSYYSLEVWRFVTFTFYAFAFLTYLHSLKHQKKILETERKLLLTEIAFLKAQINPHFLFNTLNFVFEDVSSISPKSGETILKLADMMRYSVQSTKLDFAPISHEVDAIDKYIYLQRKRFGERMYVDFHKHGNLLKANIPPLIMLSLVENAFKYGVIYDVENPIEIFLEVNNLGVIFSCKNLIRTYYKETETNAVGIANIRRRLELSYKNNFELENWIENKNYFVHLKINT